MAAARFPLFLLGERAGQRRPWSQLMRRQAPPRGRTRRPTPPRATTAARAGASRSAACVVRGHLHPGRSGRRGGTRRRLLPRVPCRPRSPTRQARRLLYDPKVSSRKLPSFRYPLLLLSCTVWMGCEMPGSETYPVNM
jgi:hypothetical protein